MADPREPTALEHAVLRMLAKPDPIPMPWADQAARFVVLAAWDPTAVMQMVYNAVDWGLIREHMEVRA